MRILYTLCLLSLSLWACQSTSTEVNSEPKEEAKLGVIDFIPTGKAEAQSAFERGMLLLHSFEYEDARTAFLETQEIDPDFGMAYWGEAMTYNHSLWSRQQQDKAIEALGKYAPTKEERLAKIASGLEHDLFEAVEVLYGEGKKLERDQAYSDYMASLHEKYPDNHEVASFYALSLLAAVPSGRDFEIYNKGAQIVQGIIAENPNHPGALHYLIHSYDDPEHAKFALEAANSYSKVAPDAAHALHMPSHIYVALGMWDEVISSNIASYEASTNRMSRNDLDNDARSYHALNWLQYGYLQQGRVKEATALMEKMAKYAEELPSKRARAYLVAMKGAHMVESADWESTLTEVTTDVEDLNISIQAGLSLLDGLKAYHQKDQAKLEAVIALMDDRKQKASLLVEEKGVPMCSAGGWASKAPDQLDIDYAAVMEYELQALSASLNGEDKAADDWFQKAIQLEKASSYAFGPPIIIKPSNELYGEWLLSQNRAEEALKQFELSLERGPKRYLSLKGKWAAANQLGDQELIKSVASELDAIQEKADQSWQENAGGLISSI